MCQLFIRISSFQMECCLRRDKKSTVNQWFILLRFQVGLIWLIFPGTPLLLFIIVLNLMRPKTPNQ
jgi:hypothetical protein